MRYFQGEFEVIERTKEDYLSTGYKGTDDGKEFTSTIGVKHISQLGQFGAYIVYGGENNEKQNKIAFLIQKLKENPTKFIIKEGGPYDKCEVSEMEFFEWKNKHLHTNQ